MQTIDETQVQPLAIPVIVMLPVFNEEPNLPQLLSDIGHTLSGDSIVYQIVAVDDGSTDKSVAVLWEMAGKLPIRVIRHAKNLGLGIAMKTGLLEALRQCPENGVIITMDSDNSHKPATILQILAAIRAGADVVVASRFQQGAQTVGVPINRRILSTAASLLLRTLFPTSGVRDYTCGFRGYRADVLLRALNKYGDELFESAGFQCMVDLLLKIRTLGVRFAEVPVMLRYDLKQGASKMHVWPTIRKTLRLVIRRRLGR